MTETLTRARHNPRFLHAGGAACPACGGSAARPLLSQRGVPSNSCLMLPTAGEAIAWPRGDIELTSCEACGFIWNRAADPALTEYSERYEPTQGWSPAFRRFHRELAARIAGRVELAGRRVLEVGCGQGEFLHLLCGLSGASGLGYDPCVDPRRSDVREGEAADVRLVPDFFSDRTVPGLSADLLVCKMTLEHIPAPARFAVLCAQVARQSAPGMRLFIQVPDSLRILRDIAFEDIYYEHCNYFTDSSLAALFAREGFRTDEAWTEYDGQYLGLLATYTGERREVPPRPDIAALAAAFPAAHAAKIEGWRRRVEASGRVVVWGSGSKGVTFLGALDGAAARVTHVVDINPHRQGMHMVGTGHPIVGPEALPAAAPDTVVVMNPVYREEIGERLAALGLAPRLLTL